MRTVFLLLVCVSLAMAIDLAIDDNLTATDDQPPIASGRRSLVNANDMICSIENTNVLACYTIANLQTVQFDEDAECSTIGDITKCTRALSDEVSE